VEDVPERPAVWPPSSSAAEPVDSSADAGVATARGVGAPPEDVNPAQSELEQPSSVPALHEPIIYESGVAGVTQDGQVDSGAFVVEREMERTQCHA